MGEGIVEDGHVVSQFGVLNFGRARIAMDYGQENAAMVGFDNAGLLEDKVVVGHLEEEW